jgi:hypothetical protein
MGSEREREKRRKFKVGGQIGGYGRYDGGWQANRNLRKPKKKRKSNGARPSSFYSLLPS